MQTIFYSLLNISAKCHQNRSCYFELYCFKVGAFSRHSVYINYSAYYCLISNIIFGSAVDFPQTFTVLHLSHSLLLFYASHSHLAASYRDQCGVQCAWLYKLQYIIHSCQNIERPSDVCVSSKSKWPLCDMVIVLSVTAAAATVGERDSYEITSGQVSAQFISMRFRGSAISFRAESFHSITAPCFSAQYDTNTTRQESLTFTEKVTVWSSKSST